MNGRKKGIRSRMMLLVGSLVLGVFLLVALVFQVLMSSYMEKSATQALSVSRQDILQDRREDRPPKMDRPPTGRAEMVLVSRDYGIESPWAEHGLDQRGEEQAAFVQGLEEQLAVLGTGGVRKMETGNSLYYFTSVERQEIPGTYVVFFINMSDLYSLQQTILMFLGVAMLGALLAGTAIAWGIASRIAGPIRHLMDSAVRMGEGVYEPITEEFQDLELDRLKQAMNESMIKLETYDTEQRTFFQNVSHELRTPLQIIKSNAEGIEYGILEGAKAAAVVREETDRLGGLVEDILYLARLEGNSNDMVYKRNDLREILSYTVERYGPILRKKGIQVEYDFQEDPVWYLCEERSMERAFQNLLSNAVRHTRDRIRISCRRMEERILVAVEDNGPGIQDAELPHIFERFYKGAGGKHGLGLSIVKAIVQSHGGRVEVSTGPGGTVFTILFQGEEAC
ncbi:sensor histidine kinase [Anaerotalea alkaliphila]|uniref:histidine kinase n=1 Tax=Anaerotalea alkaliphila TaxID=2662126 RepID=A0A7X5HV02_9FIRM|nr:HAMP domain-containing sensor histidine kinase [Anaerotalea alkaliphila]NDL67132.1 HAMP domain-containing histidine kinase [Anaerotalea alkaliphila]